MSDPVLIQTVGKFLKEQKFRKRGTNWNRRLDNGFVWYVSFRKHWTDHRRENYR